MEFTVGDVQVFDVSASPMPGGGMMRTRTSMHLRLLTSLPINLTWEVSFHWGIHAKSMMTCIAEVRESGKVVSATPELMGRLIPEALSGEATVPLPTFRVIVTGTYTVLLFVDGVCVWTADIVVSDSID
jgi:hypothetical protein